MRKFYLLLLLLVFKIISAQNSQLYYSGIFLNHKEKPQNFLKVLNKSSGIYELTDEKGFAIIAAKAYDTLVWNNGKNTLIVYGPNELKFILENKIDKKRVENVRSRAYDSLISKNTKDKFSIENSPQKLTVKSDKNFNSVRKLKEIAQDTFKLKRQTTTYLNFNGSFTTSFDIKRRNSIPQTQRKYVQGRSDNGNLVWQGPETNELFSFGPDISTLGFDKQPYQYDQNGRLIPLANGVSSAKAYNNDLFKTTVGYNNQLRLNAFIGDNGYSYNNSDKFRLSLDLGQQKDQMYFIDQYTIINSFKTKLSTKILKYSVNFTFNYEENKATNSNRIGLLNRVYQNSLLTPISFSNDQSLYLANGLQRSYSQFADNPQFLLDQENKYNYRDNRRQLSFDLVRNWGSFRLNISQSYENDYFWNSDSYQPSTYGFANGFFNVRTQNNKLYNSNILGTYSFGIYDFRSEVGFNHILNDRESDIYNDSNNRNYLYQRTSQDYIFNYKLDYDDYDFKVGANIGNAFYISNTSKDNNYWLPKAGAYIRFTDIFNWNMDFKMLGTYTQLSSEPEITRSYASYGTILFNAQDSYQYFPINEVETFENLSNINSKEWKAGFTLTRRNLNVEAEYFNRSISDDIFPVFKNNQLMLKNLADHTYSGYEVNFSYDNIYLGRDFRMTHKASFFKYKDIVDRVNTGYNNLALSGFSDIYKTLTEGQVLGTVMGSYFERNSNGQLIIDDFGYPKKAAGMKIIADPTPDFVLKFNHSFNYKMFSLDINWEWKKGGQIWNGTQAVLDYYGRSQISVDERNIKNYVFQGVNSIGNGNQIPVDFYDPNQNVSENRWTRYGYLGVAEDYVQESDYVRINNISLTTKFDVGKFKRSLGVTFYVNNILLWQANKGADPNQNFYDFDNGRGLDFFNLPSYKTFGCMVSFQF
ncbi:TonB-dependent receptor [Chryseobacterium limigenitum]|uniref:Uncharacterized protein n=1 Tax=Chryseobacterium limigenitum TaxID=1612149 RepID=A0A1K2IQV4_9FLAO|nr:TonB-dependent receptor [Chryseobacterium limigenitum]SFZ94686.1 hypothetical protein SAMN05216324_107163 [Chryseobacterium limigenitum]